MDETLYRRVLAALAATHAPSTAAHERANAYAELEAFKMRPDCPDYAMYLLAPSPGHDHFARHFALQGLSAAAARCGNDPGPAGEALRAAAASLLTSPGYVQPLGAEVGHVKEAVCRLVADLAERSFPQQWPGFMEGLLSAWQNSADGTAAELAMMVLRNIAEDCTDAQFNSRLSTGRRNDVLRGLRAHVPNLLALTYAYMSHQFQQACAAQASSSTTSAASTSADGPAACLLRASLNMVRRFHLWIRPEELLAEDHDFTQVCCACLRLPSVRDDAASCLQQLVSRKLEKGCLLRLLEALPGAVGSTPPPSHPTESLAFWRSTGALVADLITVNAATLAEDEVWLASDAWAAYLDLALGLLSHPSLRLASDLHLLWFAAFRMRKARSQVVLNPINSSGTSASPNVVPSALEQRLEPVLRAFWPKLVRPQGLEEGLLPAIYDEEFGDEEELTHFFGQFRGQVSGLLRAAAEALPGPCALAMRGVVVELLDAAQGPQAGAIVNHLDPKGRCTVKTTAVQQLEAVSAMLDIALSALPPRSLASSHGVLGIDARPSQAAADLLARSLGWQPRDPMLRACRLQLLCAARSPLSAPTLAAEVETEAASASASGVFAPSSPPRSSSPGPPPIDSAAQQAQRAQQAQALSALTSQLPLVLEACFQCMEANEAWENEPSEAAGAAAATTGGAGLVNAPSEPVAALRRRAGGALIALGRALPKELEPHLGSLAARVEAMASRGSLRPMQKMHCLEMLVAVSNAVPDHARRTTLVGQVAGESVREWCSPEVTNLLTSPQALLTHCLGIEAAPSSKGADHAVVTAVHAKVRLVGNCLNTLNSIARRVHVPAKCAAWADALGPAAGDNGSSSGDEDSSAFAPLWPLVLPNLIQLIRSLHGIWAPECAHVLRGASSSPAAAGAAMGAAGAAAPLSPVGAGGGSSAEGWTPLSHVLSMHEQELHVKSNLSGITQKKQDLMGGNDGGHASQIDGGGGGSRDSGGGYGDQDQHDHMDSGGSEVQSLEEMRCRWLSELRTLAYALLGIAAQQGALFTIAGAYSAATACLLHELDHVEHRHLSVLLKHAAEPMVLHCPPHLHATLLPPLLAPLLSHTLQRLTVTWEAASTAAANSSAPPSQGPLGVVSALAPAGAAAASTSATDASAWRTVAAAYRRDGGAVLGPEVPEATKELVIDKCRRELTRTHVAVLQSWLALSGELARAFINYDGVGKPWGSGGSLEAAGSSGGASGTCGTSTLGGFSGALAPPKNGRSFDSAPSPTAAGSGGGSGGATSATAPAGAGTAAGSGDMDAAHGHAKVPRAPELAREAAAKRQHADTLAKFLFLGNPSIAYPLAGTITAALLWPDGVQCRKAITAAHRMVGCTYAEPLFEPLLGTHLMQTAVYALVTEPKWLAGLEWDLLNLARDLYCLLAIGLAPDRLTYAVASAQGAGVATSPRGNNGIPAHHFAPVAGRPRAVLLQLPLVGPPQVATLDAALSQATDAKAQKDAMRDLLRTASEAIHAQDLASSLAQNGGSTLAAGRVPPAESALRVRPPAILDLPRQMWSGAGGGPLGGGAISGSTGTGGEEALAGLAFLFDGAE